MLMGSQLKAINLKVSTMQVQAEINAAMKGATTAMINANNQINLQEIQQTMKQFARNTEEMDVKMELMGTAAEDMGGDVDDEAEASYEQILGEVGLELVGGNAVPLTKSKAKDIGCLERQLSQLKK
eukprot:TRINITY_DN4868_c0_g1_i11.p1 TRINITY_DN4868_c0_g1~~TRINITY_DN4868_c0_g1_i11.p1  ORF type:complete len:126 (+),score=48.54 TRINITY_DN4868_c0_g1_i11:88-465(+)